MVHIQIDSRRPATQRPLRNRQSQRVHDADERNNAGCFTGSANLLTDRANIAPISPYTAAIRSEPHIFVPNINDGIKTVVNRVQETRDWKAAIRTPIGQDRRRWHEPKLGHVIIEALGVLCIIGIGLRYAGKHILIGFFRQEVAIYQSLLTKIRQKRIARTDGLGASCIRIKRLRCFLLLRQDFRLNRRFTAGSLVHNVDIGVTHRRKLTLCHLSHSLYPSQGVVPTCPIQGPILSVSHISNRHNPAVPYKSAI